MNTPQLADSLRAAVLQAAIKGELTERSSENARDLLLRIQNEKQALQAKGSLKKTKAPTPVTADEVPFEIPENWVWVRLGEIVSLSGGYAFKSADYASTGVRVVRISDFNNGKFDDKNIVRHPLREDLSSFLIKPKDILLCMTGGTVGKNILVNELPEPLYLNQRVARISTESLNVKYLFYFINSPIIQDHISRIKNSTNDNISMKDISEFLIPLPPLAEQQAIAEKLTRLLAEIDRLKAEEQSLASLQKAYPQTLRASVLAAAVRGDLNERSQEHARDLLLRIQNEKQALQAKGSLKKTKAPTPVTADEVPFEIPENWVWVRLGDLAQVLNGDRGKNYPGKEFWISEGKPFINAGSLNNGILDKSGFNYISDDRYSLLRSGFIQKNDFLYCLRGSLGKFSLNKDFDEGVIGSSLCIIRTHQSSLIPFFFYYLQTDLAQEDIKKVSNGTAQPNLSAENVRNFLIPLPPLSEQQAIVEKLNRLLAEIDALENA